MYGMAAQVVATAGPLQHLASSPGGTLLPDHLAHGIEHRAAPRLPYEYKSEHVARAPKPPNCAVIIVAWRTYRDTAEPAEAAEPDDDDQRVGGVARALRVVPVARVRAGESQSVPRAVA